MTQVQTCNVWRQEAEDTHQQYALPGHPAQGHGVTTLERDVVRGVEQAPWSQVGHLHRVARTHQAVPVGRQS